ncbi:MAG: peptidoglycan DD-metalloendopeptidase family protein [Solobacterium sp.]|nr:peptidoglycan DD-metalloendopeptidase family protein [Solobacterium sp.]
MRRLVIIFLSLFLVMSLPVSVHAEEPDYSDTGYWMDLCTSGGVLSAAQKANCQAFLQYRSNQSESLAQKIKDLESQMKAAEQNASYYAGLVNSYSGQAAALNGEISALNQKISVKEKEIEQLQIRIDQNQADIDAAKVKIKERMVSQQSSMRLNQVLDILMGAKNFSDFLRIANGLADITAYDTRTMELLADKIAQLEKDKKQIEEDKAALEADKKTVVDKQNEILYLMYQAQYAEDQYRNQMAELEAQGNRYAAEIDAIREQMIEISEKLNEVAATAGWTYPVPGAHISAGTWKYPGGGVHLGEDFAAKLGSGIYAVGNGVVINSADGCGYGNLGNGCGAQYGGSWGGGNQVYLLTKINGGLYAVKYLHMLAGTPLPKGTIVNAGDLVGQVGSSGNSSGPHCHIEVFYLGSAGEFTRYAQTWDGDLAFGCGWSTAALSRLCENGVGAPCRIKPESLFGS